MSHSKPGHSGTVALEGQSPPKGSLRSGRLGQHFRDRVDELPYQPRPADVPRLMWNTLRAAGVPAQRIDVTADETTGVRVALRGAIHDDVVVLLIH